MHEFQIQSPFEPMGDQPAAIEKIESRFNAGNKKQVLMGVTGSGKTFTIAHTIQKFGRPTLVMAPNKTLAAQLFTELKELFPNHAVGFFISYYDYYQPEAYIASTDTYIAKDSAINDDIDKMRHATTQNLFERKDVIIVASVSCIYGLGSPETYAELVVQFKREQEVSRNEFLRSLVEIQYTRNDSNLQRGCFRARGDIVDIQPANQSKQAIRVEFFGDEIESIKEIDALTGEEIRDLDEITLYPNSHYVTDRKDKKVIVREILEDLGVRLREFKALGKFVEYQRLEQRTMHDVELFEQLGFCPGIENYSRYLSGKKPGEPPPCLLDYFPDDYLLIIDESHITVPQIGGMYKGDRARKMNLVEHGFRLPSALDNRPLNFEEFEERCDKVLYVSATPGKFELEACSEDVVEQLIRPTGLVDPEISIRPIKGQVDDLLSEIHKTTEKNQRVLITTLTKKMAEDLTNYYSEKGIKVRYLHADIDSLERIEILRGLRKGDFDVLIGINLLREGLDLPEVSLVGVMDADKEGFLRSRSSLIQIVGRAARNSQGRVLFYADKITDSIKAAMDETERRRNIQLAYNKENGIEPKTIIKALPQSLRAIYGIEDPEDNPSETKEEQNFESLRKKFKSPAQLEKEIAKKTKKMHKAASDLDFETAANLRDELTLMKDYLMNLLEAGDV